MPLKSNRFEINCSEQHDAIKTKEPVVGVSLKKLRMTPENLINALKSKELLHVPAMLPPPGSNTKTRYEIESAAPGVI